LLRKPPYPALSDDQLREILVQAIEAKAGARFIIDERCMAKLEKRGLSIVDMLHVARNWERVGKRTWDGSAWRYKIEGPNIDCKWMASVAAIYLNPTSVVAITGFIFSRGRPKP
jgi:hypothetical protein